MEPNVIATRITLTPEENSLFFELQSSEQPIDVIIPDDIEPARLWRGLVACAKALHNVENVAKRLRPIVGRQLALLRKHTHLFQQAGYLTFESFMTSGIDALWGIRTTLAWDCLKIADELGFLPAQQIEEMGISKAKLIAGALRRTAINGAPVQMREERRHEWVQAGMDLSYQQLKAKIEDANLAEKGELDLVSIVIPATADVKDEWEEFYDNPEVHAYVGSKERGQIFKRMMHECSNEWSAQIIDQLRG